MESVNSVLQTLQSQCEWQAFHITRLESVLAHQQSQLESLTLQVHCLTASLSRTKQALRRERVLAERVNYRVGQLEERERVGEALLRDFQGELAALDQRALAFERQCLGIRASICELQEDIDLQRLD